MNFKNKKNILVLLTTIFLSINIVGCGMRNNTAKNTIPNTNNETTNKPIKDTTTDGDLSKRADKIADAVTKVKGVKSSKVIISNNRALVGVDMDKTIESKMTNELKDNVEKAVKNTDKKIQSVAVTADADIFKRISNITEGVRSGKPLSEFGKEIEEIFRRVLPR